MGTIELDHIFICTPRDAAQEAGCLTAFGLSEGPSNVHAGQGTACRRFFFRNAYLELLWVSDSTATQSEISRPTRLWERWARASHDVCPFGLGFRPGPNFDGKLPFRVWEYRPAYLPEPLSIQVGTNSDLLNEPMLFHLPFAQRPDSLARGKPPPLEHVAGVREISHVELVTPHASNLSPEFQTLRDARCVRVSEGATYLMKVTFDGALRRKQADFRPVLPVVFEWEDSQCPEG